MYQRKKTATVAEFKTILEMLPDAVGVEDVFTSPSTSSAFKSGGATQSLAKLHAIKLKGYEQSQGGDFNVAEEV